MEIIKQEECNEGIVRKGKCSTRKVRATGRGKIMKAFESIHF